MMMGAMAVCVHFAVVCLNPVIPVVSYLRPHCQYHQWLPFFSSDTFTLTTTTAVVSRMDTAVVDFERLFTTLWGCGGGQEFRLHIAPRRVSRLLLCYIFHYQKANFFNLLDAVCHACICRCTRYGTHGSSREQWVAANQHLNCSKSTAS